jgi:DNA-directed RNA polymerase specialized sigma24 family protein
MATRRLIFFSDLSRQELDRALPASREEDPPVSANQSLVAEAVTRALQDLSPKHRTVLLLRYGLQGSYCYSAEEVARILRCAREYVMAVQYAGLRRLGFVLLRTRA